MKYKKKHYIYFLLTFIFFLFYHFTVERKNKYISMANGDNLIKDAIDNTVNTAGYLWYNNTATIYTLLFAFLFGSTLLKLNCQNVIRISREKIGNKNLINSIFCSVMFSVAFCRFRKINRVNAIIAKFLTILKLQPNRATLRSDLTQAVR